MTPILSPSCRTHTAEDSVTNLADLSPTTVRYSLGSLPGKQDVRLEPDIVRPERLLVAVTPALGFLISPARLTPWRLLFLKFRMFLTEKLFRAILFAQILEPVFGNLSWAFGCHF